MRRSRHRTIELLQPFGANHAVAKHLAELSDCYDSVSREMTLQTGDDGVGDMEAVTQYDERTTDFR
jgi:predicted transcriptional regulator